MKTIRDAVHGDIRLSDQEIRLVDTTTFQRLRGIKQLGTSSLVYPSAVHTRFEHSVGTAWVIKRLVEALRRNHSEVSEEDATVATLAGLLHDVTHVPFGHTFEDERRLLPKHDADPSRLDFFLGESPLGRALEAMPERDRVLEVLHDPSISAAPPFVGQLVKGTIGADLLDYLKRDAFHCGMRLAYDERLEDYFAIVDGQLVLRLHKQGRLRHDALAELIHLLQLRYTLTERVYYHHAKVSAGAMISRGVELALRSGRLTQEELFTLRDDSLLDRLAQRAAGVDGLSELMDDILSRRLYRRAYLLEAEGLGRPGLAPEQQESLAERFHFDPEGRFAFESTLASELGVPASHIIVYCPSPRMQLKEADVPVEVEPGRIEPLSSVGHPDVDTLATKHRGLWRFMVLVRRGDDGLADRASRRIEEEIGLTNGLLRHQSGQLRMS